MLTTKKQQHQRKETATKRWFEEETRRQAEAVQRKGNSNWELVIESSDDDDDDGPNGSQPKENKAVDNEKNQSDQLEKKNGESPANTEAMPSHYVKSISRNEYQYEDSDSDSSDGFGTFLNRSLTNDKENSNLDNIPSRVVAVDRPSRVSGSLSPPPKHPRLCEAKTKKHAITQLKWDEDDLLEVDLDIDPLQRQQVQKSQQKKYQGRRLWTEEEKLAVKRGCQELGIGRWAEIKTNYFSSLRDRTSGQIKVNRYCKSSRQAKLQILIVSFSSHGFARIAIGL